MKKNSITLPALAALLLYAIVLGGCAGESAPSSSKPANSNGRYQSEATTAPAAANAVSKTPYDADYRSPINGDERAVNGERYAAIAENPFLEATRAPLSTFSIDVDTASYANVRRMINDGSKPPADAVRIEELVNYFDYEYPQPAAGLPFSVSTEVAACPWKPNHKIVRIGLQGRRVDLDRTAASNLVFLLDVSGSMNDPDKLPLLKQGLRTMVDRLKSNDRVAIVVYAGASGLALPSTPVSEKRRILAALDQLEAGGSTNGAEGIQLAYQVARQNFVQGGNNRVILATDGDFNVGLTGDRELVGLIESERRDNIFLSVLGFGTGNLNDSMMEKLADKGNGNYAYIDSSSEAEKALGRQVAGTLYTIAKDVKIQVEFNPARVAGYRLIGYENRALADKDFNDDSKDAGEIGSGHHVTALYEIVPAGQKVENPGVDELRYARVEPSDSTFGAELATVKLRYKEPQGNESKLMSVGVLDQNRAFGEASEDFRFAAAVAGFGMVLRDSRYRGDASLRSVRQIAADAIGNDLTGDRSGFVNLLDKAISRS